MPDGVRIIDYSAKVLQVMKQDAADKVTFACLSIERDAKMFFGPRHSAGTRTPIPPGGSPAVITGELRRSITHEVDRARPVGRVGSNLVYARIQELGGPITVKTAKFLHFVIDGAHIMVKSVYIPARPYLRRALDTNLGLIKKLFSTFSTRLGAG